MDGHALHLNRLLYAVARGAGHGCDDGQLGPGQGIQQGGLAGIRLAGNHHLNALAQQRALGGAGQHRLQRGANARELAAGVIALQKVDVLFRKIQCRLNQHAQQGQRLQQGLHLAREGTRQRLRGTAHGRFGAGVDEVGNGFGLGQVDLAAQKSALGKLTGRGQAQRWQHRLAVGTDVLRRLQATRQQQLQQHRPAMRLQLQHVFTGKGMRRRKVQRQATVNHRARCIRKRQIGRLARRQRTAEQSLHQVR